MLSKRKIIVLDCETTPIDNTCVGVQPSNMFAYDIGWVVCDKQGQVYEERSFINRQIFFEEKDLMQNAYYKDKIPQYIDQIKRKEILVKNLYSIRECLLEDISKYDIKEIYCHNAIFDYVAINNTQRWLTKSKYRYFFPYGVTICDSLKMSRDVIAKMPTYKKFCQENGYITSNGQCKLTAEILYRFIAKDKEFQEAHKGLEDVLIEKEIVAYCYKQHKKMRKKLFE